MRRVERLKQKNKFDGNLTIGVRQFNLVTGRNRHLQQRANKSPQFIDPATGLLREEWAVLRPCPVCAAGKQEAISIFVKDGFDHLRCKHCKMVYVSPVLNREKLHSFYAEENSYTRVLLNDFQLSIDRKKFNYGLDIIEEYLPQKGRLLDVGCGSGAFLELAKQRGWKIQGLEFNKKCVQKLKKMKIEIIDVPLEQANLSSDSFQCITLWTILEHIFDPQAFLALIHKSLAPGGVMLVLVPNIDSLAVRILHEKSVTFSGDSHVNFFNASTLTQILEKVGFRVKESETVLTEIGTINNYLNFENPYFGEGKPVLDFLTPKYIHDHMLGYWVLALAKVCK